MNCLYSDWFDTKNIDAKVIYIKTANGKDNYNLNVFTSNICAINACFKGVYK